MVVHGVFKVLAGQARLRVDVWHIAMEDDVAQPPSKLVSKEEAEGSFGFTTEKQGEFRFCFASTANHVDHELDVNFDLKVEF